MNLRFTSPAFSHASRHCLNGIDVHTSSSIAEHKFLWSRILLEPHQFLEDNCIHRDRSSLTGLTLGDENCPSEKVHVFPLKPEDLTAPHACVKSDRNYGTDVISRLPVRCAKQSLLFTICLFTNAMKSSVL